MKHQLYILLISLMFAFPAWSDSHEENIDEDSGSVKVQIDINDSDDSENDEENFEKSIKTSVLSIVEHILEEVADDLDEEEKSEIEAAIKEIKSEIKDEQHGASVHIDDDVPLAGIALGGLAIIFIFGTPIMIVAAVLYSSYRKKRLMHDTIRDYVATGKDIPQQVVDELHKEATPKSNLHKGLVMCGIGLGIIFCFLIIGAVEAAALGMIPLFIGLAQLLIWKLETNVTNEKTSRELVTGGKLDKES